MTFYRLHQDVLFCMTFSGKRKNVKLIRILDPLLIMYQETLKSKTDYQFS